MEKISSESSHWPNSNQTLSFLALRQLIGWMGILLPWVLIFGTLLSAKCTAVQPSISHYYYSKLHVVFVGTLCLLSGFLFTYKGTTPGNFERWVSRFAALFALGVTFFPTNFKGFEESCRYIQLVPINLESSGIIKDIHFVCAAAMFVCFDIFCFYIFQMPDNKNEIRPYSLKKRRRNTFYFVCGCIIVISIIMILVFMKKQGTWFSDHSTLIFETTALSAFGASWLLKGTVNWENFKRSPIRFFR
jgi:hypothetical protein